MVGGHSIRSKLGRPRVAGSDLQPAVRAAATTAPSPPPRNHPHYTSHYRLNLQAHPNASVTLKDGARPVRARAAEGEERQRLWDGFRAYAGWGDDIDAYARLRSTETAVVVLEPRT